MNVLAPDSKALIVDGLWYQNPALVLLLGLCPLLAVSTTAIDALALGFATLMTLAVSNTAVSFLRDRIAEPVRLPMQILLIAGTVTIIERVTAGWLPSLHASLGIFLPLIVTNCLILARSEAFARRQPPRLALIDAMATGAGFAIVLLVLGMVRELLAQGTVFAGAERLLGGDSYIPGIRVFAEHHGLILAALPPGAFLLLGIMLAIAQPRRPQPDSH